MRRCCVSKARATPERAPLLGGGGNEGAANDDAEAAAALAAELRSLKPSQLRRRAAEMGVSDERVEEAEDCDDARGALVALLLEAAASPSADSANAADTLLREELAGLKLSALRKRARAAGVDEGELDDAGDGPAPVEAIVDLIVTAGRASSLASPAPLASAAPHAMDRPHFGAPAAAPAQRPRGADEPSAPTVADGKHVMLSYQWDHQAQVKRAYDMLTRLGVKCWMDIAGGMSADIYESMAEGVSNASVVVCFMSQKYQDSEK